MLVLLYVLTATFLLLHEIESAYVKEWEILRLPGKITGFLLMHVPILVGLFYGLYAVAALPQARTAVAVAVGAAGFLPWLVHKVFVRRKGCFETAMSNVIVYGSAICGLGLVVVALV
ncbi:MAG: hypothetical protein FWD18_04535 [Micrococcales bacterium]|nr:hypothetical protein [Micrococcales bacterium]